MLPLRLFRSRSFAAVNVVALLMSFGMFGSIFFLSQFLQVVQHYSPYGAGLRVLPWTGMPMLVAPFAAALAERFGGRPVLALGLTLQATGIAWLALEIDDHRERTRRCGCRSWCRAWGWPCSSSRWPRSCSSSVRPELEGVASGTNSAFREVGGVLGIAVLGAVFSARGGYTSGSAYVAGLLPAIWVGVAVVGAGAVVALLLPRRLAAGAARRAAVQRPVVRPGSEPELAA